MQFCEILKLKRTQLTQYLKKEFVNTGYLALKDDENTGKKYSWGVRAELECSKVHMLKHAQERIPGSDLVQNFYPQCKSIMMGDSVKEKDELMKLINAQGRNILEDQADVYLLNDAQSISSRSDSSDLPDNDDTLTDVSDFSNEDASDTGAHFANTDVCDSDVGAAESNTGNASTTGIVANLPTASAD
ncbi:unnamed protein product [Orchesella dallaii]|uniref:Uncharacterized protein n=1 Tax=Orchesella dallaii TaxID=48710 RepID=A0ABP1PVS1_9HEXA